MFLIPWACHMPQSQRIMHPNADGVAVIVENILPKVEELLAKAQSS